MPIRNYIRSIREEIPDLMGGVTNRHDPARPAAERLRPAYFESDTLATYVVPGDWPSAATAWYHDEARTFPRRDDGSFEYFVDAPDALDAMLEAIETAHTADHFILLIGWTAHLDFVLLRDHGARTSLSGRTMQQIFRRKVDQGVKLRAVIWKNLTDLGAVTSTRSAIHAMNQNPPQTPARALCIVDESTRADALPRNVVDAPARLAVGSHHQKILIVYGDQGLVAFYGGVDINPDRVYVTPIPVVGDPGTPLHDVHARVMGEAALDILQLAVLRWNHARWTEVQYTHTPGIPHPGGTTPLIPEATHYGTDLEDLSPWLDRVRGAAHPPATPHHHVRIGQTIGNPDIDGVSGQHNDAWEYIRHAIRRARRFIYIEDQYFWHLGAAQELARALRDVEQVTILLAPIDPINLNVRHHAMHALVEEASRAGTEISRVQIYTRTGLYHSYVHAKMWVFDDELAIIGSANCNYRGYEYDSEVVGVSCDPDWEAPSGPRHGAWHTLELNAAHKLRMDLWSEHLQIREIDRLNDGVASTLYWRRPQIVSPPTKIQLYQIDGRPWSEALAVWNPGATGAADSFVDPHLRPRR